MKACSSTQMRRRRGARGENKCATLAKVAFTRARGHYLQVRAAVTRWRGSRYDSTGWSTPLLPIQGNEAAAAAAAAVAAGCAESMSMGHELGADEAAWPIDEMGPGWTPLAQVGATGAAALYMSSRRSSSENTSAREEWPQALGEARGAASPPSWYPPAAAAPPPAGASPLPPPPASAAARDAVSWSHHDSAYARSCGNTGRWSRAVM